VTYSATLDQITSEARKVRTVSPTRVLATVVTAPFYFLGWLVGLVATAVVLLLSAVVVGFRSGRAVSPTRRAEVAGRPDGRHIA